MNECADPETWACPVCLGTCACSQCNRKKTKESLKQAAPPKAKVQAPPKKPEPAPRKKEPKPLLGKRPAPPPAINEADWAALSAARAKFEQACHEHWALIPRLRRYVALKP